MTVSIVLIGLCWGELLLIRLLLLTQPPLPTPGLTTNTTQTPINTATNVVDI